MRGMFNGASAFNQPRVRPAIIVARMFNISSSTQEAVAFSRGCTGHYGENVANVLNVGME